MKRTLNKLFEGIFTILICGLIFFGFLLLLAFSTHPQGTPPEPPNPRCLVPVPFHCDPPPKR